MSTFGGLFMRLTRHDRAWLYATWPGEVRLHVFLEAPMIIDKIRAVCVAGLPFAEPLQAACTRYKIDSHLRQAHFLAQVTHESGGFKRLAENLNYSAEGLVHTWPTRFRTRDEARPLERQPEKIANRVYANRLGNGDEASGDGWRFRGRGLLQLTGRKNYGAASRMIFDDERLLEHPELVELPETAAATACWFWDMRGLNEVADDDDLEEITRRINGAAIGIEDRRKWLELYKEAA